MTGNHGSSSPRGWSTLVLAALIALSLVASAGATGPVGAAEARGAGGTVDAADAPGLRGLEGVFGTGVPGPDAGTHLPVPVPIGAPNELTIHIDRYRVSLVPGELRVWVDVSGSMTGGLFGTSSYPGEQVHGWVDVIANGPCWPGSGPCEFEEQTRRMTFTATTGVFGDWSARTGPWTWEHLGHSPACNEIDTRAAVQYYTGTRWIGDTDRDLQGICV